MEGSHGRSWRPAPVGSEDGEEQEDAPLTVGTARRAGRRDRRGRGRAGGRGKQGGRGRLVGARRSRRSAEQRPGLLEVAPAGRTPEAVVPDFGTPAGQDVLEEALEKLDADSVTRRSACVRWSRQRKVTWPSAICSSRLVLSATRKTCRPRESSPWLPRPAGRQCTTQRFSQTPGGTGGRSPARLSPAHSFARNRTERA